MTLGYWLEVIRRSGRIDLFFWVIAALGVDSVLFGGVIF